MTREDRHNPEYERLLKEAAAVIDEQNGRLIERTKNPDFKPDRELEYCQNGAARHIHRLFEAVAKYEEGKLPFWVLADMRASTAALLEALKGLRDAPTLEIDAVGVAFGEAMAIFEDESDEPRMAVKTYLKKVFGAEREICARLRTLHEEYVKRTIVPQKPERRKRRCRRNPEVQSEIARQKADRRYVLDEISRLVKKGYSVRKAICHMRLIGSWKSRLGNLKAETWRRYYQERSGGHA